MSTTSVRVESAESGRGDVVRRAKWFMSTTNVRRKIEGRGKAWRMMRLLCEELNDICQQRT